MPRSVETWVGATPDTPAPLRVRVRVFEAKKGRCHRCGRKIGAGDHWTLEHLIALINGGRNAEDNLDLTCDWCLPVKNAADMEIKSKSARIRAKHIGAHQPKRKIQSAGFRRPLSNTRYIDNDGELVTDPLKATEFVSHDDINLRRKPAAINPQETTS